VLAMVAAMSHAVFVAAAMTIQKWQQLAAAARSAIDSAVVVDTVAAAWRALDIASGGDLKHNAPKSRPVPTSSLYDKDSIGTAIDDCRPS